MGRQVLLTWCALCTAATTASLVNSRCGAPLPASSNQFLHYYFPYLWVCLCQFATVARIVKIILFHVNHKTNPATSLLYAPNSCAILRLTITEPSQQCPLITMGEFPALYLQCTHAAVNRAGFSHTLQRHAPRDKARPNY